MAWSYSGDPSTSELDEYRFYIGDVDEEDPLLQDGEIQFILSQYQTKNTRMYKLLEAVCNKLSKEIKRSLGPQAEDPTSKLNYYMKQKEKYEALSSMPIVWLDTGVLSKPTFQKGMHDNV